MKETHVKTIDNTNLTHKTFSGTLYLITSGGIQIMLKIGVLAVLARLVAPKEFGLMGIAVVIVEFSKLFSQMGVGPCIVQRKELEERHLTTGFTLSLLLGLLFAGTLILLAPSLESFFKMNGLGKVLRAISSIFLVNSITVTGQALLQRNMKFKLIASVEVLSYAIGYGAVGIILAYMHMGVWALVIANLSQALLSALFYIILQPFSKKLAVDLEALRELVYFGFGFTIAKMGNFLAIQGDNLVVGRTLGAAMLGIYGRAYNFMVMPSSLFGNALDRTLFPAMAKVQDNKKQLAKAYITGTSLIALVAIPISFIFMILAPEIILTVLGKNWVAVVVPFRILAASLLFRMSYKMSDSLARSTGAVYSRAWRQIIYACSVFVGAYIGHFYGLGGVATGVAASLLINFLLMGQLGIRLTGITWKTLLTSHLKGLYLGLFSGTICLISVTLLRQVITSNFLVLLLSILCVIGILCFVIWAYPRLFIGDEQKSLLNKLVLKRFKKPLAQAA
ncbi:MAG: lipopolysaccharide biosynthesis protein [Flavisolibacter sp.]